MEHGLFKDETCKIQFNGEHWIREGAGIPLRIFPPGCKTRQIYDYLNPSESVFKSGYRDDSNISDSDFFPYFFNQKNLESDTGKDQGKN